MSAKQRLLFCGDAAIQSGFARCTHETCDVLREDYDITVLGINYRGDPHSYPYPIYPCLPGGDALGWGRIEAVVKETKPDVIVLQNDPWNIRPYLWKVYPSAANPEGVRRIPASIPVVGAIAVDGKNCKGWLLNDLRGSIFWTRFALDQARFGGFKKPGAVVGLGVDLQQWYPENREEARRFLFGDSPDYTALKDAFIVLNVNRNQPRKRLDLTIRYFAKWIKGLSADTPDEAVRNAPIQVHDAFLYLHVAPTGDENGYDCDQLASYYGVQHKLVMADLGMWKGVTDETLRKIYAASNIVASTSQGEGWGLTTIEAMACGRTCIFGDWSALGEWASPAGYVVPCSSVIATAPRINTLGGVPDEGEFIEGLDRLYNSPSLREEHEALGLALVNQSKYRWRLIGESFREAVRAILSSPSDSVDIEGALVSSGNRR